MLHEITLADKLRKLRESHGYHQEEVAAYLNVVRQTYSNYETGIRYPNVSILCKLSEFYHISLDEMVKDIYPAKELRDEEGLYEFSTELADDFEGYLTYIKEPENAEKLNLLDEKERKLIYLYNNLSDTDQEDFLLFCRIKANRNKKKK